MSIYQKSVGTSQAIGVPGAYTSINPIISTPLGYIAESDVQIGGFVWEGNQGYAKSTAGDTAARPLGFVVREVTNPLYQLGDMSSDKVPTGHNVSVQIKGDFYAISTTDATAGQKVFAVVADGTIKTGAAGVVIDGAVETDWAVALGGDADTIIMISNY